MTCPHCESEMFPGRPCPICDYTAYRKWCVDEDRRRVMMFYGFLVGIGIGVAYVALCLLLGRMP